MKANDGTVLVRASGGEYGDCGPCFYWNNGCGRTPEEKSRLIPCIVKDENGKKSYFIYTPAFANVKHIHDKNKEKNAGPRSD